MVQFLPEGSLLEEPFSKERKFPPRHSRLTNWECEKKTWECMEMESSSSSSCFISELDYPLTEQQLLAIEAIEATFQSNPTSTFSIAKKRPPDSRFNQDTTIQQPLKTCRRLPNYLLSNQIPLSVSPPPCQEESKRFPVLKCGGHIIYSRTAIEVEKAAKELLVDAHIMRKDVGEATLGFDIEWKPTFRRGAHPGKAAVMQLCLNSSLCHVMHIIHSGIPQSLRSLLEDPTVKKVGVGISSDAVKVFKDHKVSTQSVEDLSNLANRKLQRAPQKRSLKSLAEIILCKQLPKHNYVRLGNWEVDFLSKEQLEYAAMDAFASLCIYEALHKLPDLEEIIDEENEVEDLEVVEAK